MRALDRELARRPFDGFREAVPDAALAARALRRGARPARRPSRASSRARLGRRARAGPPGRLHEVETLYGGEDGPDLEPLARARGL